MDTSDTFLNALESGVRPEKPEICPEEIYDVMLQCWRQVPEERPSFEVIYFSVELTDISRFHLILDFSTCPPGFEYQPGPALGPQLLALLRECPGRGSQAVQLSQGSHLLPHVQGISGRVPAAKFRRFRRKSLRCSRGDWEVRRGQWGLLPEPALRSGASDDIWHRAVVLNHKAHVDW